MPAKAKLIRVDAQLQWNVIRGNGLNWVGVCDPLKLTVQSESYAELMEDISLTLDAILKDLLSTNELTKFLRLHGWEILGAKRLRANDPVRFDVPFTAMMAPKNGSKAELSQ